MLSSAPRALDHVLEAGTPIVTFSWGQPGALIKKVHQAHALAGVQVGSVETARQALDAGADFIICQDLEAGGHVQSTTPLADLLPGVVETAKHIPS